MTARILQGISNTAPTQVRHDTWVSGSNTYATSTDSPDIGSANSSTAIRAVADPLHPDRFIVARLDNSRRLGAAVWENGAWKGIKTATPSTGDFSLRDTILEILVRT